MSGSTPQLVQSVSTSELYNRWAKVYDTDGNILQALDDHLIPALLSRAFAQLPPSTPITVTELGTGTGRNTVKLLSATQIPPITHITALDLSPSMLTIARTRCTTQLESLSASLSILPTNSFYEYNALSPLPSSVSSLTETDFVLSTLVIEHLPLDAFFRTVKGFLREGGVLVLTNMHAEMGRRSQAGFVDEETGQKVRGESYVHEIEEVVEEGRKWGFGLVGEVGERAVERRDLETGVVGERGKKWVDCKCWFGMVLKQEGSE